MLCQRSKLVIFWVYFFILNKIKREMTKNAVMRLQGFDIRNI